MTSLQGFSVIILVTVVTTLPSVYTFMVNLTRGHVIDSVMELTSTMILLGCVINPVMYVFVLREFRMSFHHILTCRITCPPERRVADEFDFPSE